MIHENDSEIGKLIAYVGCECDHKEGDPCTCLAGKAEIEWKEQREALRDALETKIRLNCANAQIKDLEKALAFQRQMLGLHIEVFFDEMVANLKDVIRKVAP